MPHRAYLSSSHLTSNHHHNHYRSHHHDQDESSEISCCLKYLIFSSNVVFWLFGLMIMLIGIWAWTEKDIFNNFSRVTNIALDPAFVLIVGGCLAFVIGFTGCIGALRENTFLLAGYAIFLAILLLFEMTAGILGFIFKDWIKSQAANGFQAFIVYYRDDPDRQNLVDWIQDQWLGCCGVDGPKDWDQNIYFNCSSVSVGSREACGVPFSCCKPILFEMIRNKQCGYDVRKSEFVGDKSLVIYEKGCLRAGEEWIESNLVPVAGATVVVAVLQLSLRQNSIYQKGCLQAGEEWFAKNILSVLFIVLGLSFSQILGICFAQNLRADIFAQKAKWN